MQLQLCSHHVLQRYDEAAVSAFADRTGDNSRPHVMLTKDADIKFVTETMAGLREWDAAGVGGEYVLAGCNSFLRRALYEKIQVVGCCGGRD